MSNSSLNPFFTPTGVAIVGASTNPTKLGYSLANNLLQSGYTGAVHFVNPSGGTLLERPLYPTLAEVPDPVDLAVLLIPAPAVPSALVECGQRGIRAVILASGGFRETGPEGAALEDEAIRVAHAHGIRLIGPNCIGLLDTHLPLDTTFLPPPGPTPGDVAFISHSGAICAAVIDWARGQGFGLSRLVSLGNQADVTETDILAPVAADPYTRVLTLYLEGVGHGSWHDGLRFVSEASKVTRQKPVIALKVGRFKSGQQAVASHTGALAGQETAYNAAFRRAGVIRAETSEEMFDWARALAWCPPPRGRRVAVLTNAGGPGVTAADALEMNRLELAPLTPETVAALQTFLPSAASFHNPVDMLASASPEHYARSLRALLEDSNVDSVMVILPPPPMFTAGGVARAMIPIIQSARKPVVIAVMGERMIQEAVEYFRAAHVPEYRFPERAAGALNVLTRRAETLAREVESPLHRADVSPDKVARALSLVSTQDHPLSFRAERGIPETNLDPVAPQGFLVAKPPRNDIFLPQETAIQILAAYGIPTLALELARDAEEAGDIAARMGFPVALKVASPDIPHKSDVGGVLLDVRDRESVRAGFATVIEAAKRANADALIEGVHLQRMVSAGQEVITGTVWDAQFGPLVMFGSGGVEVEGLKDVAFALAPATRGEIEEMLANTWAGRKLRGFRNLPPADREAVIEVLTRLGQLAADFPHLAEMEINPLRVLREGAVALDVRIKVDR